LEVDNATDAAYPQVAITAVYNPPGTNDPDVVTSQTGRVFVAETPESFQYDSDGNLTQDGRFDYTWNGENRLIKAETRDDIPAAVPRVTVEYAYDHQGRMAWKQISTNAVIVSTRTLLWDGYNIIQARTHSQTHTLTNSFLWGLDLSGTLQGAGGVGGLLAEVQDGEPYFAAFDANGNVTEYLTADGTLAAHREYSPCGETIAMTGTEPDAFLHWFSTKPWCAVTGLSEYEFRKYSPSMERWLSRDPLGDHASPGARILHGEIAARMAFAAIVNLHIALDEELDDHDRIIAILNTLYWFKGIQTLRSGDPSIGFGWFDPLTGRWFSNDPMGISGGLNQYVACGNSLVTFVDPLGLRLWQAQYWADRSIRGIWINRAFSTVMGVLASAVPDVITLDGRVAGALLGGGEFGGGAIINLNDGSVSGYDTRGPGVGRQGLAPSLTLGVGWNSDVTAPKNISFEGPFHEFSVSWSRSAVGETASYYIGGGWQGINYGITRPGFGYMYTLVEYDVWEGDAPPQSPYGDGACK
jgi:RHS repeat-associated protein